MLNLYKDPTPNITRSYREQAWYAMSTKLGTVLYNHTASHTCHDHMQNTLPLAIYQVTNLVVTAMSCRHGDRACYPSRRLGT